MNFREAKVHNMARLDEANALIGTSSGPRPPSSTANGSPQLSSPNA
jgi:hypothetical protein